MIKDTPNIFNNNSNEEIALIIYNEFVKDKSLRENNIKRKIDSFEKEFWLKHQIEEELLEPELVDRIDEISCIIWEKTQKLKKELKLKENDLLTTKTDEEIAEMIFSTLKKQTDLSSFNTHIFWSENGVENVFEYPQSFYYRWEKIQVFGRARKKKIFI